MDVTCSNRVKLILLFLHSILQWNFSTPSQESNMNEPTESYSA